MTEIHYKEGMLIVPLNSILEDVSYEEAREIADALSINDDVVKNVSDQILDGWTEMDSYAYKSGASIEPTTALSKAIRRRWVDTRRVACEWAGLLSRAAILTLVRSLQWAGPRGRSCWHPSTR